MKTEHDFLWAYDAPVRLSSVRVRTERGAVASFQREAALNMNRASTSTQIMISLSSFNARRIRRA
jgi:hypothetical protein